MHYHHIVYAIFLHCYCIINVLFWHCFSVISGYLCIVLALFSIISAGGIISAFFCIVMHYYALLLYISALFLHYVCIIVRY